MAIHNIHVDDTRATFPRSAHLLTKTGKVRRKNRRCQLNQSWSLRTRVLVRNSLEEILTRRGAGGPAARLERTLKSAKSLNYQRGGWPQSRFFVETWVARPSVTRLGF